MYSRGGGTKGTGTRGGGVGKRGGKMGGRVWVRLV